METRTFQYMFPHKISTLGSRETNEKSELRPREVETPSKIIFLSANFQVAAENIL